MRFEFNQGVPKGCIEWLWENGGEGNIYINEDGSHSRSPSLHTDDWHYERVEVVIESKNPHYDSNARYVPTITIVNKKLATLFALRWAGQ